jgi:hypothetical protein
MLQVRKRPVPPHLNSSNSSLTSCKSLLSNPSAKQLYTLANS